MPVRNQSAPGDTFAGALSELRAVSTAGGGTALSTTAALIPLPKGATRLYVIPRNFATAVVAKLALNPWLVVLRTQDDLASVSDFSENAQDADAGTDVTLSSQGTAAQGDYLYLGAHVPFRGVKVDVDGPNGNASVLTVKYWDGSAWTDITATDGTAAGGASLAQDGDITWTVPTAWGKASLKTINSPTPAQSIAYEEEPLYWVRLEFSAALDAAVTLNSILAYNRNTAAYSEWPNGVTFEQRIERGLGGVGCLEALTNAGTANLIVNAGAHHGSGGLAL